MDRTRLVRLTVGLAASVGALGLVGCNREFKEPMTLGGVQVSAATLNRGHDNYNLYCLPCHGVNGDGKGISSTGLRPPPRDFTQGLFKFGGVAAPALPTDEALVRIVRGGLHGTAMLPWEIPDDDLTPILQYIKTFSPRWKTEKPGEPVAVSPDPFGEGKAQDAIALGKKLYHAKAQCSGCHPSYVTHKELFELTGGATSEFSAEMYHSQIKDSEYCLEWKPGWTKIDERECVKPVRVMPPDFTRDPIRNVRLQGDASPGVTVDAATTINDIYRTIAAGIGGANMPTWKGTLSEPELWGLTYYVRSLMRLNDPTSPTAVAELATLRKTLEAPDNLSWSPPKTGGGAAGGGGAAPGGAAAGAPAEGGTPAGASANQIPPGNAAPTTPPPSVPAKPPTPAPSVSPNK